MYVGGIVGYYTGNAKASLSIQNCANYGTINHVETTTVKIGGIIRRVDSKYFIENCVALNTKIIASSAPEPVGNVVGNIEGTQNGTVKNCYWLKKSGDGSTVIEYNKDTTYRNFDL